MSLPNEVHVDSTQELLDAQARVWKQIFNFINSMSLKCAVQLSIPDVIHQHGKPMTLSQLADALPINKSKSHALYRLMRILSHSKFFDKVKISKNENEEKDEAYCLTRASRLLLKDGPLSMATFTTAALDPIFLDPWHHMFEWFQNDSPSPFVTKHGRTLWEYAGSEQRWNQVLNEALASDARLVASILTKECKHVFERLETVVDVGGGTGMVAKAIVDAFPELKCVVVDLPHVVDGLEGAEDLSFVAGDMFESIPCADAVLLKWILHDWSDEDCVKILKKCKEAITQSKNNGRKVIIVDMVVDDRKEDYSATETQLFFDMQMMVEVAGIERNEKEWATIFSVAGFANYKITPVLGLRSVIEVFP